jgi:hypothetical protein
MDSMMAIHGNIQEDTRLDRKWVNKRRYRKKVGMGSVYNYGPGGH